MTNVNLTRQEFEDITFSDYCIFTGQPVDKRKGEHVIPRWLISDYSLNTRKIEIERPEISVQMKEFRAPAEQIANNDFGKVEERIKLGSLDLDELHLWQKKISVGMVLNHWRLAGNTNHPFAPSGFDDRYLAFALKDFQNDFSLFRKGGYRRTGSTFMLPTKLPGGWIAHVFGSVTKVGEKNFDSIMPFALIAISHRSNLLISALHDGQGFELSNLITEWNSKNMHEVDKPLPIQAALAVTFADFIHKESSQLFQEPQDYDPLLNLMAYQLGIKINKETLTFQARA